jgi:hypothetical protein
MEFRPASSAIVAVAAVAALVVVEARAAAPVTLHRAK